jgi:hypothetical protein
MKKSFKLGKLFLGELLCRSSVSEEPIIQMIDSVHLKSKFRSEARLGSE